MLLMYGLGMCEHCGIIVTMEGKPIAGRWLCSCGKELTNESFGIKENGEKVKWIGPEGKWVDEKPEEDFKLGDLHIVDHRPGAHFYSR